MNRLDQIELEILTLLLSIDGLTHGEYTYTTKTGQVQVYDNRLNIGRNGPDIKEVNHVLEQQEDVGVEGSDFDAGQYAFTQVVIYEISSKLYNDGDENNAKNSIRSKMNGLIDDLLYLYGNNYTLNGKASQITFESAFRDYDEISNNRIQSGELITRWRVLYTQSIGNPSIPACA